MLFVKECILPVAMQTKALILVGGCTDDSLYGRTKGDGANSEQDGGELPVYHNWILFLFRSAYESTPGKGKYLASTQHHRGHGSGGSMSLIPR